jgi:bacterioferritin-associated ferredoxin
MIKKHRLLTAIISGLLLIAAVAIAQARPEVTITSPHPRLVAGQKAIQVAWDKITTAQEFYRSKGVRAEFGGHVANAKRLLEEANAELQAAADVAESK